VTCTETRLACLEQASFLNIFWSNCRIAFSNTFPVVDRRLNFEGISGLYRVQVKSLILLPSKDLENAIAECSDCINGLGEPMVALEGA
jgi:hypothetical protein